MWNAIEIAEGALEWAQGDRVLAQEMIEEELAVARENSFPRDYQQALEDALWIVGGGRDD